MKKMDHNIECPNHNDDNVECDGCAAASEYVPASVCVWEPDTNEFGRKMGGLGHWAHYCQDCWEAMDIAADTDADGRDGEE